MLFLLDVMVTFSHWPAILEGPGVDERKNGRPGTQITLIMIDYLICVVIGFGGYCERSCVDLTSRRLHLCEFCMVTISHLSLISRSLQVLWTFGLVGTKCTRVEISRKTSYEKTRP